MPRHTRLLALFLILAGCGISPYSRSRDREVFSKHESEFVRIATLLKQSRLGGNAIFVGPTHHDGEVGCRARRELGEETGGQVLEDQSATLCPLVERVAINAGVSEDGTVWFCVWTHGAIGNDGGFVLPGNASKREALLRNPPERTRIRPAEGSRDWLEWEHNG